MKEVAIPSPLFTGSWHDSRRWTRSRRAVAKRPARSRCASRLQNRIMAAGDRPVYCRLSTEPSASRSQLVRSEAGVCRGRQEGWVLSRLAGRAVIQLGSLKPTERGPHSAGRIRDGTRRIVPTVSKGVQSWGRWSHNAALQSNACVTIVKVLCQSVARSDSCSAKPTAVRPRD